MTQPLETAAREPCFTFVAGFSHDSTPLRLREKYCLGVEDIRRILEESRHCAPLRELVVLNTCNRLEVYAVSARRTWTPAECLGHILRMVWPEMPPTDFQGLIARSYLFEDEACLRHLIRTASGLDSMVVGEAEIAGQVKEAYRIAHAAGATGPVLNRFFQNALSSAKRVRAETDICRGCLSVGTIAVQAAIDAMQGVGKGRRVLVCGAGQMGSTIARTLRKRTGFEIVIANRTFARARALADQLGAGAAPLSDLPELLPGMDAVFAAAGAPGHLLAAADLRPFLSLRPKDRPFVLVDVSVPRGIDPAARNLAGAMLMDLEDLGAIARANERRRRAKIAAAGRIADDCVAEHMPRLLFAMGRGQVPEPSVPIRPTCTR